MKIVVFSDSHGIRDYMTRELKKLVKHATINYIIHLGDLVRDAQFLQENFPDIPVLYVCGNCDYTYDRREQEKEYELGGKKFFILHGDTRRVKYSPESLENIAAQKDYDIILYGHTHEPRKNYTADTYIINPGSISYNRDGRGRSYCVIDIAGDNMGVNIIYV